MKISIRERYATVPNELLNNPDISLKAKGLFAYLQSKPDNWSFSIDRMASQLKENRDAIRGAIKELEEHGYLIRKRRRENGKWNGVDYLLTAFPSSENPTAVFPPSVNSSDISNKDISKKEYSNKEKIYTQKLPQEKSLSQKEILSLIGKKEKEKSPPISADPPKKKEKPFELVQRFAKLRGIFPDKGWRNKELRFAKLLLKNYTIDEVIDMVEWRIQEKFWDDKLLSLSTVYKFYQEWKSEREKQETAEGFHTPFGKINI
jgi:hypothetical protein